MDNLPQRKSYRLQKYNYTKPGYYYITICTNNRVECFGAVSNKVMVLNKQGEIAERFWLEIPKHYENVSLDVFVVMPNHIHGIIISSPRPANGRPYNISKIIGSYKNVVSKEIHKLESRDFIWQHSFYDHIIRSEQELGKIREYIVNNPHKWDLDRNNPKNFVL